MKKIVMKWGMKILLTIGVFVLFKFIPFQTIFLFIQPSQIKIFKLLVLIAFLIFLIFKWHLHKKINPINRIKNFRYYLIPFIGVMYVMIINFEWADKRTWEVYLLVITSVLMVAISEEFTFRVIIQSIFIKEFGLIKGIILASTIFALLHFLNILINDNNFWGILNQVMFVFSLGILFGTLFYKIGNIYPIILLHFIFNLNSALNKIDIKQDEKYEVLNSNFSEAVTSLSILLIFNFIIVFSCIRILKRSKEDEK